MSIAQYDLLLVNLDPTVGSEIRKTRPCVVLSPDEMNRYLRTIVIAPVTNTSKSYPTRVKIRKANVTGWIAIDQLRTIDRMRIIKPLGRLSPQEIRTCKEVMKETFID